ncbi:hypothetical protein DY000_02030648 [Brassica cretica]|uniref:Uncharacterized protein n=1 Tax=Brassica cretica TaxID=69181 RepID=A0ABQ7DL75_BRACR|nr:hypothetical protein DY000_02030648 [Brassica cretica]
MARRPFLRPPVPRCDKPKVCSSAFLQHQILVFGLEDNVAGASIIYQYPFHQEIHYSERYDQGVMIWGENPFLLLGREAYFVGTQERAFWLGCLWAVLGLHR